MKTYEPHCSSTAHIAANLVAMAGYIFTPLFGLFGLIVTMVLFFSEKNSGFVKFHTMQAALLWILQRILYSLLSMVGGFVSFSWFSVFNVFDILNWAGNAMVSVLRAIVTLILLLFCVLGALNAYRWNEWHVPLLGQLAQRWSARGSRPAYHGDGPVPPGCESANYRPGYGGSYPGQSPYGAPAGQPTPTTGHPYQQPPANGSASGNASASPHGPAPGNYVPPPDPAFPQEEPAPPYYRGRATSSAQPSAVDPNTQVPPEMRDPPPPSDMFD